MIFPPRQQEVANWLAAGKTNNEIGQILGISPLTVKNHVQIILRKLNVPNRTAATAAILRSKHDTEPAH